MAFLFIVPFIREYQTWRLLFTKGSKTETIWVTLTEQEGSLYFSLKLNICSVTKIYKNRVFFTAVYFH